MVRWVEGRDARRHVPGARGRADAAVRGGSVSRTPVIFFRPGEPREILMVACHNFDLDAARGVGYRTAFVRRPDEWGPAGPPDPVPNPATDVVVGGFAELADHFGA